jgi:hypothetical protein
MEGPVAVRACFGIQNFNLPVVNAHACTCSPSGTTAFHHSFWKHKGNLDNEFDLSCVKGFVCETCMFSYLEGFTLVGRAVHGGKFHYISPPLIQVIYDDVAPQCFGAQTYLLCVGTG